MTGTIDGIGGISGELSGTGSLSGSLSGLGQVGGALTIPRTVNGTTDYERLKNKPSIESVVLSGNKDFPDLGLSEISADDLLEILI